MKIVDIAQEIYSELGDPDDFSVPAISTWLRNNIGLLDNKINRSFVVADSTYEITPDMGETEKTIFKKMYDVHYYERLTRSTLGAASTDSVLEVSDGVGMVRKINKNELSKTYLQAKKDASAELKLLVDAYKVNDAKPNQIAGDDTVIGIYAQERNNDLRAYNRV
jgi:hypothetical protein